MLRAGRNAAILLNFAGPFVHSPPSAEYRAIQQPGLHELMARGWLARDVIYIRVVL